MKRVLFVSNGHGEAAISARLAQDVYAAARIACDHLSLVGDADPPSIMQQVGPRRAMPSGGLLAMGNVRNILKDFRSGLLAHTVAQLCFLRAVRGRYDVVVAVGDIFALLMAKRAGGRRTAFVGTAKSVYVAPYGPMEERVMRGADAIFVRDAQTAARLRSRGVDAAAPGNVIVDLFGRSADAVPEHARRIAIFPGSRESAYGDAAFLCAVLRRLAAGRGRPSLGGTLSIAPVLDADRFKSILRDGGWEIAAGRGASSPFLLTLAGRPLIDAWTGPPGSMLNGAVLAMGQAGTANEAAASLGVPVAAFTPPRSRQHAWYRTRQRGLLGEAMRMIPGDVQEAAAALDALLRDDATLREMSRTGRERMGPAGGSAAIAAKIAAMVND
ncbi:MAG: hypothetical protein M3126_11705 [Candidatus Eremiobacteraeota bacterium]|nr:hypothetical protein [Candidatus Eremiobacteraeota bacterium]